MKKNKKINCRLFILLVILSISIFIFFYFSTSLFYEKNYLNPITLYYKVDTAKVIPANEFMIAVPSKQEYQIDSMVISIEDSLFNEGVSKFELYFKNFTQEVNFWDKNNQGDYTFNQLKKEDYIQNHHPDYAIVSPLIKNGKVPIWSQVWSSARYIDVATCSFIKETSFGVWEAEYFFNPIFSNVELQEETFDKQIFLPAQIDKIIFKIKVPEKFVILSKQNIKIEKNKDGYLITQELSPGENFHIVIKNPKKEFLQILFSKLSILIIGILLGMFIQEWYDKKKK